MAVGLGSQHLSRDLVNVNVLEKNVRSLLLYKFSEIFAKIWGNMALYFVTVWSSTSERTFI